MNDDFWAGTNNGNVLDLEAFFDSDITDALRRVISLGVLVSLGLTRDGGALGITILDAGRKRREYFRSAQDGSDWLHMAAAALSGNGSAQQPTGPPVGQKPTRGR